MTESNGNAQISTHRLLILGLAVAAGAAVAAYLVLEGIEKADVANESTPPVLLEPIFVTKEEWTLPPPVRPIPRLAVFFPHDSSSLDDAQSKIVRQFARALQPCGDLSVDAVGSSSSVSFQDDPEDLENAKLADRRAETVKSLLMGANSRLEVTIPELEVLVRTYADTRERDGLPHPAEWLNRRVDVLLRPEECEGGSPHVEGPAEGR